MVRWGTRVVLALGAWVAMADRAQATIATDLCTPTADPCVILSDRTITAGSDLDFGSRALVIHRGRTIDVGPGNMTIHAGRLTVEPGAIVGALGGVGVGGTVEIFLTGDMDVQVDGTTKGRLDASGDVSGGSVLIQVGGNITIGGALLAQAGTTDGDGGLIDVTADGNITMSGTAAAGSGSQGGGGDICFSAGGSMLISGPIDASGGDVGGGSIELDAGTTLSAGFLDLHGGGSSGDGGFMTLTANGDITLTGQIDGTAAGTAGSGGGSGADMQIVSLGSIRFMQQVIAPGGTPDGDGGSLDVQANGDVIVSAPFHLQGIGTDSCGGDVSVVAGNNISVGLIDVSGGSCGVGSVLLSAVGTATLTGEIDGDAGSAGTAATIDVSGDVVQIGAVDIHADAGTAQQVHIAGCTINIPAGASVESLGTGGENLLQASGQLTMAGALRAGAANHIEYRSAAQPPLLTGIVQPAAASTIVSTLPACRTTSVCGNGQVEIPETCDDGNTIACDGCSSTCRIERCGNGVVECAEQCDLGAANGAPGSPCDAQCHPVAVGSDLLLIPGRPAAAGCFLEWGVRNPHGAIRNGFPSTTQSCVDGDPLCDGDGANDGSCSFQLSACIHMNDARLPDCRVLSVASIELRRPSLATPLDAVDAANATQAIQTLETAFSMTVLAEGVTVRAGGFDARAALCSAPMSFVVPHPPGGLGRRRLYTRTLDLSLRDSNSPLKLVCLPNPAVCGNGGPPEIGEQCDDGNRVSCDGCSANCRIEACGNGVTECSEECDDGPLNGTAGDACRADCTVAPPPLRLPGGGHTPGECALEWSMALATPTLDRKGLPDAKQDCTDNDPACDFDPTPGVCRFHLWACAGGGDTRLQCPAASVESVALVKPSDRQPGPLRDALLAGLSSLSYPVGPGEACSRRMDVSIPANRRRVSIKATASSGGLLDKDGLKLRCDP